MKTIFLLMEVRYANDEGEWSQPISSSADRNLIEAEKQSEEEQLRKDILSIIEINRDMSNIPEPDRKVVGGKETSEELLENYRIWGLYHDNRRKAREDLLKSKGVKYEVKDTTFEIVEVPFLEQW